MKSFTNRISGQVALPSLALHPVGAQAGSLGSQQREYGSRIQKPGAEAARWDEMNRRDQPRRWMDPCRPDMLYSEG